MLYQECRPQTFDEVVGNVSMLSSLRVLVKKQQHPHTFLFSGPSGCGKTTLARIVAKEVGCKDESVVELNAANTRGIDTSRSIASNADLSTVYGGSKAYILDESQQMTRPAQQALLKVIEDVPKQCYFFFCTTDPGNLIPTLRNRCTEFQVHSLREEEIFQLLTNVVVNQGIEVSDEVLAVISESCEGCPRRALVSLEKVKDVEDIDEVFDIIIKDSSKSDSILDLYKALIVAPHLRLQHWQKTLGVYNNIEDDPERVRIALLKLFLGYLNKCSDVEVAEDVAGLIKVFSQSTFYGGKALLGALVVEAIWSGNVKES